MSLHKRNGIWYYDFILNGKRFSRTTGERSKAAAKLAEARVRAEVKDSIYRPAGLSMTAAIKRGYTERWRHRKDGDQAVAKLERICAFLGDPPLVAIGREQVENVRDWLEKTGHKDATVNRYMASLKTLLRMAHREWGLLPAEVHVKLRPEQFEERRALSEDEVLAITAALVSSGRADVAGLVRFLVDTGMRLSEALSLTGEDIRDGCAYLVDTKNGKPRVVPLTQCAQNVAVVRGRAGRIFPFQKWKAARAFKDAVVKSGVDPKGVCLHSLRHTCCTKLVSKGAGLAAAGAVLGHSSATMTRRYSHLDVATLRNTVALLE